MCGGVWGPGGGGGGGVVEQSNRSRSNLTCVTGILKVNCELNSNG